MDESADLIFRAALPVQPNLAGHLVSRGVGRHLRRIMNGYELIFVCEGVLEIAEENREFRVSAAQTLLLRPDRWHYGTKDYPLDLSFFWIHFDVLVPTEAAHGANESGLFHIPQHANISRPDYLAELYRRYLDDYAANRQDPIEASLLMQLMLNEVQMSQILRSGGTPSALAARAQSFIRTHFHLPLTARVVADHVGCNPHYLSRIYRQSYDVTLTDAIQRTRVDYACRLLLGSDLRVGEIARACGMDDANYFHQLFKRRKGLTPTAFRRLHAPANVITE